MTGLVNAEEGTLLFMNENASANISQLQMTTIPGQTNATKFRIVAVDNNITNIALFAFGDLNVTLTPPNITHLNQGDFSLIELNVSLANDTVAGTELVSIIILTSRPEQRLLPLIVIIPETGGWNITVRSYSQNVTLSSFRKLNITLVNSGNVPVIGRVSRVDLHGISWFDTSDFNIQPLTSVSRPMYYFIKEGTKPGIYQANYTFTDSLGNSRRFILNLTLPDVTPPEANISFSRPELYPDQKTILKVKATDDVQVDRVWGRISTGPLFNLTKKESGVWEYELKDLKVGNRTLATFLNDTSGNLRTIEKNLEVIPYDYLVVTSSVNFYKFRLGTVRQVKILSSIVSTDITVKLKSLSLSNTFNNSINVTFWDKQLILNEPVNFTVSGDIYLTVHHPKNYTKFEGVIEIKISENVRNPQPEVRFKGEVAEYAVAPPMNFTTNGIFRECKPDDKGTYENSSYVCTDRYPVDSDPDNLLFCQSKASHDAEIGGWKLNLNDCKDKKAGLEGRILFVLIIILVFGAAFGWYWLYKREHGSKLPLR